MTSDSVNSVIPASEKYGLTMDGRPIIDARHALRIVLDARSSGKGSDGVVMLHHPRDFVGSSFRWVMASQTKYADRFHPCSLCIRGRLRGSHALDVSVVFK